MNAFATALLLIVVAVHTDVVVHADEANTTLSTGFNGRILSSKGKLQANCANDMDFTGTDISNFRRASFDTCFNKCKYDSNCFAFTYTNYQGGTCWMKSNAGDLRVVFGARACGWGSFSRSISSCDMPGNDIESTSEPSGRCQTCVDRCKHTSPPGTVRAATLFQDVRYCKSKVTPCITKSGASTTITFD